MEILRREFLISSLLRYMKEELEIHGTNLENVSFSFKPSYTQKYIGNHPPELIPDEEDLAQFKKREDFSNEEFEQVFKYCLAHGYIKHGYDMYRVKLTEEGLDRAIEEEKAEYLEVKTQKEQICINTYKSKDKEVNTLLLKAKQHFTNGDIQEALEKLWDALERVKTLLDSDKSKGIQLICKQLSDELEFSFFNEEYLALTRVGNNYRIRHSETGQKPVNNLETKKYLFFRALSLINLTLSRI